MVATGPQQWGGYGQGWWGHEDGGGMVTRPRGQRGYKNSDAGPQEGWHRAARRANGCRNSGARPQEGQIAIGIVAQGHEKGGVGPLGRRMTTRTLTQGCREEEVVVGWSD